MPHRYTTTRPSVRSFELTQQAESPQLGNPGIETIDILLDGTVRSCYDGSTDSWFATILCSARLSKCMQRELQSLLLTDHANRLVLEQE